MTSQETGRKYNHFLWFSVISLAAIFVRVLFLRNYPQLYSFDGFARIIHIKELHLPTEMFLLGGLISLVMKISPTEMPLLGALISLVMKISPSIIAVRFFMILLAGLTCGSFYLFVSTILNKRAGIIAGILLIFSPVFLLWSTVPYSETLFFLFIFLGLYFLERKEKESDFIVSSILLGLACFTRYEGWLLGVILFIWYALERKEKSFIKRFKQPALYFLWAPVLWLIIVSFFMKSETSVKPMVNYLSNMVPIGYFLKSFFWLVYYTIEKSQPTVSILGMIGLAIYIRGKKKESLRKYFIYLVCLYLLTIIRAYAWTKQFIYNDRMFLITDVFLLVFGALTIDYLFKITEDYLSKTKDLQLSPKSFMVGTFISLCVISIISGISKYEKTIKHGIFDYTYETALWLVNNPSTNILVMGRPSDRYGYFIDAYFINNNNFYFLNFREFDGESAIKKELSRMLNKFRISTIVYCKGGRKEQFGNWKKNILTIVSENPGYKVFSVKKEKS